MFIRFFFAICFISLQVFSEEISQCHWQEDLRLKGLSQLEESMNWKIPFSSRSCFLLEGKKPLIWKLTSDLLKEFEINHGYFSRDPLVGIVTKNQSDIQILQDLFLELIKSKDSLFIEIATEELITKVLAYRNLVKGMIISLPYTEGKKVFLVKYRVDDLLDLWQGMPAFGLVPLGTIGDPILLFRGTDFSLSSRRSWASVVSDFDCAGPGFSTFSSAKEKISSWLEQASKKVKVMGFSLGGSFAIYTAIYYPSLIQRCVAFNAPGVSKTVLEVWNEIKNPYLITLYATQGDFVSKLEQMVPRAFELSDKTSMGIIQAHTKIMTGANPLLIFQIDVDKENASRLRTYLPNLSGI